MARPIYVPGSALGFPRVASWGVADLEVPIDASLVNGGPGFPFWKYVALSVTAGVITHYIIRRLERKLKT